MIKKNLLKLFCLFILAGIGSNTLAINETEPNDVWSQADFIALGATGNGTAGLSQNQDWWHITSATDGKLTVNYTSINGLAVWCQIYDTLGVLQFASSYTNSSNVLNVDGLTAGTYYLKFVAFDPADAPDYSFVPSWTTPAQANDAEPNGTRSEAKKLNLNSTKKGHIGYHFNNLRDTLDWYKVTTTVDGRLDFKIHSFNGQNVYLEVYDNDATTLLGGGYTTTSHTWVKDGLATGTYYLRVRTYYNIEWAPYSIQVNLVPTSVPIDIEPNGKKWKAETINPDDSITGHIGYYYKHLRDTFDYRKITIVENGKIQWTISSLNGQNIYVRLYDHDGITILGGNYTSGSATYSVDGLRPGTYYFIIRNYYNTEFSPYTLKTKFYKAGHDPENNNSYATAQSINSHDSLLGTVGYYYNGVRDSNDWFALTTNDDGQLNVSLYPFIPNCVYLQIYDKNGTTQLYSAYTCGGILNYSRNDLAKGTYYINIHCYYSSAFTSYALVNKLANNNPTDSEPNGYAGLGQNINGYSTKTGNINYYHDGAKDGTDWFMLGYYALGNFDITVNKVQHTFDANYPDVLYRLYLDTTLTPLDSVQLVGNVNTSYNHVYTGLAAGTYYIRITPLNNTFGGYSIKANYKDTTSQTVTLITDSAGTTCGAGKLTYFITRGKPPYSVQLYKDGVASGAAVNTSDTAKFTSLNAGYYSVTTRSTTAITNTVSGKDTTVVPKPVGLATTAVTTGSAILKWTGLTCVDGYKLQWRLKGTTTWTTIFQAAGATQDTINGLAASTQYQFRVYAYVLYIGSTKYYGLTSATKTFTTPAIRLADNNAGDVSVSELEVYPNPATDKINFVVDNSSPVMQITISNSIGQQVKVIDNYIDLNQSVDVSELKQGVYFVTIKTSGNLYTARFVKE